MTPLLLKIDWECIWFYLDFFGDIGADGTVYNLVWVITKMLGSCV